MKRSIPIIFLLCIVGIAILCMAPSNINGPVYPNMLYSTNAPVGGYAVHYDSVRKRFYWAAGSGGAETLLNIWWQTNTTAANSIKTSNDVAVANLNVTGALTFTNLFYYSRTNPVTGNPATNAAMPWGSPGKYHMGITDVGVRFTNITVGITDGTWVNHLMTNNTAATTHVYIPTNIFMLTNSGSFVQLDPFSGTNWDFFLSNGCTAVLALEATTGTGLRNVHGYFVTYRP